MGIEIIGKLTQKNNGDFKLVDLENVDYDGTGKNAKQEIEKKIEDVKNSLDAPTIKSDIQDLKDNKINLIEDETSMEGISDTEHDTLETKDKRIIGAINEVNSQCKDIANNKADTIYLNVKDFGAKGDGTTDDTQAFQNALNSLNVKYPKLYIPKGHYLITSPLVIELKEDITISGDSKGDNGTRIDYQNSNIDNCFKLYGVNNLKMTDFRILCNGNKGILFGDKDNNSLKYRSGHTLLQDVFISNTLRGVTFDCPGGFNEFIRVGIDIANNGIGFDFGSNFNNINIFPNYAFITNCNIQNSLSSTNTIGINLNAIQYMQITRTDIAGCNIGINITNTKEVSNILISNNYFFKNKTSMYIKTGGACRNITLRDNNHLFENGTFLNIQNGTNSIYSMLIDGDYFQGTLQNGYILNNVFIKISNTKSHFVKLNQNSTIGTKVSLDITNMKPTAKTFTLAKNGTKEVNFEVDTLPIIFSDAVVIHSESANVTQSQINGALNIAIVNTYDGEQTFTVFIP